MQVRRHGERQTRERHDGSLRGATSRDLVHAEERHIRLEFAVIVELHEDRDVEFHREDVAYSRRLWRARGASSLLAYFLRLPFRELNLIVDVVCGCPYNAIFGRANPNDFIILGFRAMAMARVEFRIAKIWRNEETGRDYVYEELRTCVVDAHTCVCQPDRQVLLTSRHKWRRDGGLLLYLWICSWYSVLANLGDRILLSLLPGQSSAYSEPGCCNFRSFTCWNWADRYVARRIKATIIDACSTKTIFQENLWSLHSPSSV